MARFLSFRPTLLNPLENRLGFQNQNQLYSVNAKLPSFPFLILRLLSQITISTTTNSPGLDFSVVFSGEFFGRCRVFHPL